ncbi:hypothetical protein ACFLXF_00880 [Chloroflexota bacterium]
MKLFFGHNRYLIPVLIMTLIVSLILTGCEDFQQYPTPTPQGEQPAPEEVTAPSTINSGDKAILAVYEHLLVQAESHEAKSYIADFYAVCDNWTAELERFKDGSSVWYVVIDMSEAEPWEWPTYWQQASWLVFKDGKVIPSNRQEGNALRIEAELQEMSLGER